LKDVPREFFNLVAELARQSGDLLGSDKRNEFTIDERFCVGLVSGA
jgi:hypothetical protein